MKKEIPVSQLKNLGEQSARMLAEIGVNNRSELEQLGAVSCFKMLKAANIKVSRVMLYALYGALNDIHWNQLSAKVKDDLIRSANSPDSPFDTN